MTRQATLWSTPPPRSASAISGPTMSPAAWAEKTIETSLPRSFLLDHSLISTALTG
jgi:hypothetical protein